MRRLGIVFVLVLVLVACRDPAPAPAFDAGPAEVAPSASAPLRHAEATPDAASLPNPLCEGMSLSLFETSCEVPDAEWVATPAPERGALAQEAKRGARSRVVFSIVNKSAKAVLVPLRFDDLNRSKSFTLVAELTGGQGIYALAPPVVGPSPEDAGGVHLHSTRIRLLPGGRASTHMELVDFLPGERLDKRGDAGKATPKPLEGAFTIHIGQLLSHVEMGDPAKVQFVNDIRK